MSRQAKPTYKRRCDWMTDEQLQAWIKSCSSYLGEALEEQQERAEAKRKQQAQEAQP